MVALTAILAARMVTSVARWPDFRFVKYPGGAG